MLDIGAGRGVITRELVRVGARVIAVELHRGRAAGLRERFAGAPVTVVRADAADLRLPQRPFTVVANPPFGITTALVRRLTSRTSRLERACIVLPTWAVERWASGRGGGSRAQSRFLFGRGPSVPARAFRPAPPNPTRVLTVARAKQGR